MCEGKKENRQFLMRGSLRRVRRILSERSKPETLKKCEGYQCEEKRGRGKEYGCEE